MAWKSEKNIIINEMRLKKLLIGIPKYSELLLFLIYVTVYQAKWLHIYNTKKNILKQKRIEYFFVTTIVKTWKRYIKLAAKKKIQVFHKLPKVNHLC